MHFDKVRGHIWLDKGLDKVRGYILLDQSLHWLPFRHNIFGILRRIAK